MAYAYQKAPNISSDEGCAKRIRHEREKREAEESQKVKSVSVKAVSLAHVDYDVNVDFDAVPTKSTSASESKSIGNSKCDSDCHHYHQHNHYHFSSNSININSIIAHHAEFSISASHFREALKKFNTILNNEMYNSDTLEILEILQAIDEIEGNVKKRADECEFNFPPLENSIGHPASKIRKWIYKLGESLWDSNSDLRKKLSNVKDVGKSIHKTLKAYDDFAKWIPALPPVANIVLNTINAFS